MPGTTIEDFQNSIKDKTIAYLKQRVGKGLAPDAISSFSKLTARQINKMFIGVKWPVNVSKFELILSGGAKLELPRRKEGVGVMVPSKQGFGKEVEYDFMTTRALGGESANIHFKIYYNDADNQPQTTNINIGASKLVSQGDNQVPNSDNNSRNNSSDNNPNNNPEENQPKQPCNQSIYEQTSSLNVSSRPKLDDVFTNQIGCSSQNLTETQGDNKHQRSTSCPGKIFYAQYKKAAESLHMQESKRQDTTAGESFVAQECNGVNGKGTEKQLWQNGREPTKLKQIEHYNTSNILRGKNTTAGSFEVDSKLKKGGCCSGSPCNIF
ncbi:hypothetical protein [Facilibium subflavum]|uniref:hypothetical protein n=1 Tax=Facilibium subflavum TaxID=2219058 RepID=UPI000E65D05A|nr:hypothetical protein [Facilibium subflavum]